MKERTLPCFDCAPPSGGTCCWPGASRPRWTFKVWAIVPAVLFFVTTLTIPTMSYYLIGLVTLGLNLSLVAWTARTLRWPLRSL